MANAALPPPSPVALRCSPHAEPPRLLVAFGLTCLLQWTQLAGRLLFHRAWGSRGSQRTPNFYRPPLGQCADTAASVSCPRLAPLLVTSPLPRNFHACPFRLPREDLPANLTSRPFPACRHKCFRVSLGGFPPLLQRQLLICPLRCNLDNSVMLQ